MPRLYTDEHFPLPASEELRRLGHDVLTCQDSARADLGIQDYKVLEYAVSTRRILLTQDRVHYMRLHKRNSNHFGILICTENYNNKELAQRIHEKLAAVPNPAGKLLRVYRPG